MAAINTGYFPKTLWPGLNVIYTTQIALWEKGAEWRKIFVSQKSNKNYEEDLSITSFAPATIKPQGENIEYDTFKQGYVSRYNNVTYAKGCIITMEELQDNLYPVVGKQRTESMAKSMYLAREYNGIYIINNAFNPAVTYGDDTALCNNAHPITNGTLSNVLAGSSDLNEAALEQAAIAIRNFTDDRGYKSAYMPQKLLIPHELEYEATRILKNADWRPDTANRDINALYVTNTFPGGIVISHYMDDPDAWFILTNADNGLKYMDRMKDTFTDDNSFDDKNAKFSVVARYSFGCSNWRHIFGSPGV